MLIYVGTYTEPILFGTGKVLKGNGEGIYVFRMDPASGALEPVSTVTGVVNPSFLALDDTRRFLYAVNELKSYQDKPTGTVSAFAVDGATGNLSFLNKQPTHGTDPCHLTIDAKRHHVFVANFMSGSVCVLPVHHDGGLKEACQVIQHQGSGPDPVRQSGPHAHSVTLDRGGRYAYVPDLGLDKLFIYRFDAARGVLEPNDTPWIRTEPGSGPRHLALHPGGRFAYLINELNATVTAMAIDGATGVPREMQIVSTVPKGFIGENTCAGVRLTPSGEFLYASNRGHDSIAIFRVDHHTGRLEQGGHVATEGKTPRGFGIDPNGEFLLVANQDSDSIVTFRIEKVTGMPRPTGHITHVPTPVCVTFSPAAAARSTGGQAWPR
jgi:6-phosphogluconolactonase